MPRVKTLSNLIQSATQQAQSQIQVEPSHISLFCAQKQGEYLLDALPDVKPVDNLEKLPLLKAKILKKHTKLEASAREAFKLSLASNLIRSQEKFIVVNSQIFKNAQSQQSKIGGKKILQSLKGQYIKYPRLGQKLSMAMNVFPLQSVVSAPELQNKWILDGNTLESAQILKNPYKLLINPTILYGTQIQTLYEECISFPFMEFMIPRYNKLLIHFYNEQYKSQFAYTSGFLSRVIQHQCEHLEGKTIIDWRINHGMLTMNQSVLEYFPKASSVIQDYAKSLKSVFKDFPQLIAVKSQYVLEHRKLDRLLTDILKKGGSLNLAFEQQEEIERQTQKGRSQSKNASKKLKESQNYNSGFTVNKQIFEEQLPFEDDYVVRIVKHFKKQFAKFDQKIQLGLISPSDITKNKEITIEGRQSHQSEYSYEEYSRKIKISYLNEKQAGIGPKLSEKQERKIRSEARAQSGNYQASDQELEKALAKHNSKKGKKRK